MPRFSVSNTHPDALERLFKLHEKLAGPLQPSRAFLEGNIEAIMTMIETLEKRVAHAGRPDLLDFYGSMYLPSYTRRVREDRIEF